MTGSTRKPPFLWRFVALVALFTVALATRVPRLGLPGLSSDEAFSWRLTQYGWADVVRRAAADVHPPLYFLLLKAWLGVWGTSAASLRGLSIALGLAAMAIGYVLCRRVARAAQAPSASEATETSTCHEAGNGGRGTWRAEKAGLFALLFLAVHAEQVEASRNARMYTLGMACAGLSAYFLFRALESRGGRGARWWAAHGTATAAFFYAHYYAFFTYVAQALLALWECAARTRRTSWQKGAPVLFGLLLSGAVTLLLFGPWIPALLAQVREVRGHYWIPEVSVPSLQGAVASWTTGLAPGTAGGRHLSWLLLAGAVWVTWRVGKPAAFFFVQAATPWFLSLGLSAFSGRPIFLERYLIFSQFFFLALWAVGLATLERLWERVALVALVLPVLLYGLGQTVTRYPGEPSATELAVRSLTRHDLREDLVLTTSPRALNRLRFYATQAGLDAPSRCVLPRTSSGDGRFSHAASIEPRDILWADEVARVKARRLFRVDPRDETPLEGWNLVASRFFEGGDGSQVILTRFGRGKPHFEGE